MVMRWQLAGAVDNPVSDWGMDAVACEASASPELVARAYAAARSIVWNATCRRFPGVGIQCAVRWFPEDRCRPFTSRYRGVYDREGSVLNLDRVFAYPLISVDRLRVVGPTGTVSTMPATGWRWDRPDKLVKQNADDGTGAVFSLTDRFRPFDWPGQWWLEATIGENPPAGVFLAAVQLGRELVLAETDPEQCSLPDNIRTITRQGTTLEFDRTEWSALPLMKEITKPWPAGFGCEPTEYGRDPARGPVWAEIPWDALP